MALFDFLRDDKGLFQGGAEGRAFGRTRDRLDQGASEINPYRGMSEIEIADKQLGLNPSDATAKAGMTRLISPEQADTSGLQNFSDEDRAAGLRERLRTQDFANTSNDEMRNIQSWLNNQGYRDNEGMELMPDGVLGPKTLASIRNAQAGDKYNEDLDRFGYGVSVPSGTDMNYETAGQPSNTGYADYGYEDINDLYERD
jgi:hypothetical protein